MMRLCKSHSGHGPELWDARQRYIYQPLSFKRKDMPEHIREHEKQNSFGIWEYEERERENSTSQWMCAWMYEWEDLCQRMRGRAYAGPLYMFDNNNNNNDDNNSGQSISYKIYSLVSQFPLCVFTIWYIHIIHTHTHMQTMLLAQRWMLNGVYIAVNVQNAILRHMKNTQCFSGIQRAHMHYYLFYVFLFVWCCCCCCWSFCTSSVCRRY